MTPETVKAILDGKQRVRITGFGPVDAYKPDDPAAVGRTGHFDAADELKGFDGTYFRGNFTFDDDGEFTCFYQVVVEPVE